MTNNTYGLLNLVSRSTFLNYRAAQLFLRLISRGGGEKRWEVEKQERDTSRENGEEAKGSEKKL